WGRGPWFPKDVPPAIRPLARRSLSFSPSASAASWGNLTPLEPPGYGCPRILANLGITLVCWASPIRITPAPKLLRTGQCERLLVRIAAETSGIGSPRALRDHRRLGLHRLAPDRDPRRARGDGADRQRRRAPAAAAAGHGRARAWGRPRSRRDPRPARARAPRRPGPPRLRAQSDP